MQHPDEGMIHSWLDSALSSEEAAQVESHVSECASCAAAVAEARGFIAASSRILTALDNVPRGVLPAVPAKKRDFRVLWRAAAAMLVVAGGSLVVMREGGPDARVAATSKQAATAETAPSMIAAPVSVPPAGRAESASEAKPLPSADAATVLSAPTAPASSPQVVAESRRARNLDTQSDLARASEPAGKVAGGTGAAALSAAPSAIRFQANQAAPASPSGALRVVRVERAIGSRRTIYEIGPSQTVTLTEPETNQLSQIVVTGSAESIVRGSQGQTSTREARTTQPLSAEAAKAPPPPPAAPAMSDSKAGADSAARSEITAMAKTPSVLQGQLSAAPPGGANTISWTEARTGKTLTLSGNVSVERLQEIRKRIERERTAPDAKIP